MPERAGGILHRTQRREYKNVKQTLRCNGSGADYRGVLAVWGGSIGANMSLNKYEKNKRTKEAAYKSMEKDVSLEAKREFNRKAYQEPREEIKEMLILKKDISFLHSRAGMLDKWEAETIRRIADRIRKGA